MERRIAASLCEFMTVCELFSSIFISLPLLNHWLGDGVEGEFNGEFEDEAVVEEEVNHTLGEINVNPGVVSSSKPRRVVVPGVDADDVTVPLDVVVVRRMVEELVEDVVGDHGG